MIRANTNLSGEGKMKKVLSVFIAICMLFAFVTAAFAGGSYKDAAKLRFDENGKFKILVLADVQDDYPIEEDTIELFKTRYHRLRRR